MNCFRSAEDREYQELKKRNDEIEEQIKADRMRDLHEVKLLLLGILTFFLSFFFSLYPVNKVMNKIFHYIRS